MPKKRIFNSILICVGINTYRDKAIRKLYYCCSDCIRVTRTFNVFNICNEVVQITQEDATLNSIKNTLLSLKTKTQQIYFYYSGHGHSIQNVPYLYAYDTNPKYLLATGLAIPELIQLLRESKCPSLTLILDACNMTACQNFAAQDVTILAPDNYKSYEDTAISKSIFTTQTLINLSQKYKLKNLSNSTTKRYQKIRQNIEHLLQQNDLIFICGASGIGKSHFLRQINDTESSVSYVAIPNIKGITFEIVLNIINENICSSIGEQNKIMDADPKRHISFFAQTNPHFLLLIDQIDHLHHSTMHKLVDFLLTLPFQKILSSRSVKKIIAKGYLYHFPKMLDEDIDEALALMGINDSYFVAYCKSHCKGKYINLLEIISEHPRAELPAKNSSFLTSSIKEAISAITISGGFLNQKLFEQKFGISNKEIDILKNRGMLISHDGFCYPHDSLYDIAKKYHINKFEKISCQYWREEIVSDTTKITAIQHYILAINSFSLEFNSTDTVLYENILNRLEGRQNSYFFLMFFDYLKNNCISKKLKIKLINTLIDIGKFQEAAAFIKEKCGSDLEFLSLLAEIYWWSGEFNKCIKLASVLLLKKLPIHLKADISCARGIGYFFLGEWKKATNDLERAINLDAQSVSAKTKFFSYYVIATIQGIRGTNFQQSTINFKYSIQIAKENGKIFWLSLVYGNIGEVLWKAGFYKKSSEILEMSNHLAYLTGNDSLELEINRNLLHVYHRSTNSTKEQLQLKKLETIFNEQVDSFTKMQIINTLITHYILNANKDYKNYLNKAETLTSGNAEYQIYTKANHAITALYEDNKNRALTLMEQALALCQKGENWLAIKQILEDWDEIISLYQPHLPSTKQVFQKWHQILEKKLRPSLSHLSHLCEYLE
jgi:tetratricopeptide (TPR) repeat protein